MKVGEKGRGKERSGKPLLADNAVTSILATFSFHAFCVKTSSTYTLYHFGPYRNISSTIGWFAVEFDADMRVQSIPSERIVITLVTFHQEPPSGQNLSYYQMPTN